MGVISTPAALRVRGSKAAAARVTGQAIAWGAGLAAAVFAGNLFEDRYLFWDSYLDLGAGRLIAHDGIPHHEVFTVTALGSRWIDQQWLAHLLTYASWAVGGYPGVAIASSLAVATAFGLLNAMMITRGVHPQRAIMWTGGAFAVCLGNTVVRAQVLAYPLFVLLLWGLLDDAGQTRFRRRNLLALPLLILWANLHGSVLLAALLVMAAAAIRAVTLRRRVRLAAPYAALALVAPLTIFATPYGISVVHYYGALIGNPVVSTYILEWAPPSFGNPFSIAFILMLLVTCGVMGFALARGQRPGWVPLALLLLTAGAATQGVRYAAWFGLTAAALNAETLARTGSRPYPISGRTVRAAATIVAAFTVMALGVVVLTPPSSFERLQPREAMAAAAAYALRHPGTTILADDTSSSALLWKYPRLQGRVAYDARLEEFTGPQLERWFRWMIVSGTRWRSATRSFDVVVISRNDHPALVHAMLRTRGWRAISNTGSGVALVRTTRRAASA